MNNQCQRCLCAIAIAATFLLAGATFAQPDLRVVELREIGFEPMPDEDPTSGVPTGTFGINNKGEAVFTVKVGTDYLAFVALPLGGYGKAPGVYKLPFPSEGSDNTVAHDINDDGIVVGHYGGINAGEGKAIFWNLASWTATLPTNPSWGPWTRLVAVTNDDPAVAVLHTEYDEDERCSCLGSIQGGKRYIESRRMIVEELPGQGSPVDTLDCSAASDSPDPSLLARDIQDGTDEMVGYSEDLALDPEVACFKMANCLDVDRAIHWDGTTPTELDDIDGDSLPQGRESHARGINSDGNIAGFGTETHPTLCPVRAHAWEDEDADFVNLGAVMPGGSENWSRAEAINAAALVQVVGWDIVDETSILWINDGTAPILFDDEDDWIAYDLKTRVATTFPETLPQAHDINDQGWIIVYALLDNDPEPDQHFAWLLVPIADCPADLSGDGSVGFADLLQLLSDWGPCDPAVLCLSDISLDGSVGFADLLAMLSAWGSCPGCPACPEDDCADRDLGENCECRDTLTDLIENGTTNEEENARCWLEHYLTCHDAQGCNSAPNCPDADPCGKH